jgi:hypothetical protein
VVGPSAGGGSGVTLPWVVSVLWRTGHREPSRRRGAFIIDWDDG